MKALLRKSKKRIKKPMIQMPWIDKAMFDFEKKWIKEREEFYWRTGGPFIKSILK